ncbi:DUF1206 domain-containing protein [Longispora sp. NPDC051575]|uniref:DUF1206 domain-containing protein n=1 Tax=Longispora sp. NPDC051575 TaxID=3154943 RepID=UPI003443072B
MSPRNPARQAADSDTLEFWARAGLVGWGVTHLLVAFLAAQIALGRPDKEGDQSGALATIAEHPFGVAALVAVALGFLALVVWQGLEAAVGDHGAWGRVAAVGRAVIYGALALSAGKLVFGQGGSKADQQQTLTAKVLSNPGGQWLVGLLGVAVVVGAGALVWYGLSDRYAKHLSRTPTWVTWSARVGYAAKGLAYGIVGALVVAAAVTFDAAKSRGLDEALRTLAAQRHGTLLLGLVAAGLAAYGVFGLAQARYRKI